MAGGSCLKRAEHPAPSRQDRLRGVIDDAAHLLPRQGPIGVFVHHNTLHAFEHLAFEEAVIEASQLFGAEPYMAEAAYRAELARGRIHLEDIDAVLDSEPDALVFPRLSRRSLRRAMITPGVREFDAATDSVAHRAGRSGQRLPPARPAGAVRRVFRPCSSLTRKSRRRRVPVDEIIHPWLIRLVLGVPGPRHGLLADAAPGAGLL